MSGLDVDPAWLWLIGGVVLLIAEVIAPGFSLIFIGAAAILTGVVTLLAGFGVALQLGLFVILAFLAVKVGGRSFYASRYDYTSHPELNRPEQRLLGKVVTVSQPVDSNGGRVRLGDSEWSARGGPAALGAGARIVTTGGICQKSNPEPLWPPVRGE